MLFILQVSILSEQRGVIDTITTYLLVKLDKKKKKKVILSLLQVYSTYGICFIRILLLIYRYFDPLRLFFVFFELEARGKDTFLLRTCERTHKKRLKFHPFGGG